VEQKSLEKALNHSYAFHADVTDCYAALYTHSIAWALHGKSVAKQHRTDPDMIGNILDRHIQAMHEGQTNGIPQGSVLMDLIAEFVLSYADSKVAEILADFRDREYDILRYRDDYRIFVNNPQTGEEILKVLTEELSKLGLKLNSAKTKAATPVVGSALKPDKWAWMCAKQDDQDPVRHLLLIYEQGARFPNSGQLIHALQSFRKAARSPHAKRRAEALIGIAVEISVTSPRAFPSCAAVISDLLPKLPGKRQREVIAAIHSKMQRIPYNGHMEVWLQRIGHRYCPELGYKESLCQLVQQKSATIWKSDWLPGSQRAPVDPPSIVDQGLLARTKPVVATREVSVFDY
jgi:hypothetical protein